MCNKQTIVFDYAIPLQKGKFKSHKRTIGPEIRKRLFEEANFTCEVCDRTALPTLFVDSCGRMRVFDPKTGLIERHNHLTLDHIVPKSFGSTNYEYNLIVLCEACNN